MLPCAKGKHLEARRQVQKPLPQGRITDLPQLIESQLGAQLLIIWELGPEFLSEALALRGALIVEGTED
jgi:hypothetical protein